MAGRSERGAASANAQSGTLPEAAERLLGWFASQAWQPAKFQHEAWRRWQAGESFLLHAPTGAGKTLAAVGGYLIDALRAQALGDRPSCLLWVTPMRALAQDTAISIETLAQALDLAPAGPTRKRLQRSFRVECRTADVGASLRSAQLQRLPEVLITTPESLSLLLSYPSPAAAATDPATFRARGSEQFHAQLRGLAGVVVDEWHELIGNKRGVQLELCLARLRRWQPGLRVLGLSATIGNLGEAHDVLMGAARTRRRIVEADTSKRVDIAMLMDSPVERYPRAGHTGLQQLPAVLAAIDNARTTLLFTNTRSQAEIWYQALAACLPDADRALGLHHGSLDKTLRSAVEQGLKTGQLRCVVATSSLDLGVDFPDVEQCIQLGSPKGLARLLQRAGRSGHTPSATSRLNFVPTHALELLELHAAQSALARGIVECRCPPRLALDVLAQHLLTLALGGGIDPDEAYAEVRSCASFADLRRDDFDRVLRFLRFGGEALSRYPEFQRLVEVEGRLIVADRRIAQRHRIGIGTIVADAMMQVRGVNRANIGAIEESFVARLRSGDRFVLAGRTLEMVRVRDLVAYVRAAKGRATVPRWMGGKFPLSSELADAVRRELHSIAAAPRLADALASDALRAIAPLLAAQARRSRLPRSDQVLVERTRTREGWHLFVFPFAGRHVNEGLAALLAQRLCEQQPNSFSFSINDYGFELLGEREFVCDESALRSCFRADEAALQRDLLAAINASELARRQFREIARIAGLVQQSPPGQQKSARQLQASAGLLFDTLSRYDPQHVLIELAHREVLERHLNLPDVLRWLRDLQQKTLLIADVEQLSPLAFPLWASRLRGGLSNESASERIERMAKALERADG